MCKFDLIVIGAGPAGQKAALHAAKRGKKVAVIEREAVVGGSCVSTGTLPSKTLRETVHYLAGMNARKLGSGDHVLSRRTITFAELLKRKTSVINHEIAIIQGQLDRNGVEVISGEARFVDEHMIEVDQRDGAVSRHTAKSIIIATGSRPRMPEGLDLSDDRFINSDTVLDLDDVPSSLAILGGGVIGCEYACVFARLGTKVTIVDRRERLLRFLDNEITDALTYHLRTNDVTLKMGEDFETINANGTGRVQVQMKSGKIVSADKLLFSMGRISNIEALGLEALGIETSETGLVQVNENYQTHQPNIYAVGDVIGFPALASTSMEQGRLAACHALGGESKGFPKSFPYGIFTIPEISYAGQTEWELTRDGVSYEMGRAEFSETARGQILSDHTGMLKLLFDRETHELLGVHIIGESATELIHIGQAVMAHGGKVEYFVDNVFNYPTLAECYKIAAWNGLNRL